MDDSFFIIDITTILPIYILSRPKGLVEEYQGNMGHLEGKCNQTERKMVIL